MSIRNLFRLACVALLLSAVGQAAARSTVTDPDKPRQLDVDGPVSVSWDDPAQFSEIRYGGNRWEAEQGDWVVQLARHMRKQVGKFLPEGQRMDIHITDIDRAGRYEPRVGNLDRVRIVRDIYPPRISFTFTRTDANGQVIDQGERKLSDMAYLSRTSIAYDTDNLTYEKRMIDEWVRREVKSTGG